jgi:hypothetical protein
LKIFLFLFLALSINIYCQVSREWVKRFNGSAGRFDIASDMNLCSDRNIIVYGNTSSVNSFIDIIAIKYSPSGNILWQTVYNGSANSLDECKKAIIDSYGNSYITGFSADSSGLLKILTLKISPDGIILWHNTFLPVGFNQGLGINLVLDGFGNLFVAGSLRKLNGSNSAAVIKYSAGGIELSHAIFNITSQSSETPVSVCTDSQNNIYVLGSTNFASGYNDILLLKYNNNLNFIHRYTFSGTALAGDIPVKMIAANDNKLALICAMNNSASSYDYGIFRFDTSFNLIMQYIYNGTGNNMDIPYDIFSDTSNNIYVTGSSRNADTLGSEDFYTMKIDPTAFLLWGRRYNSPSRGHDYGISISVDRFGNVYAGGTTDKHDFHQQYALLKYSPTGDLLWLEEYSKLQFSEDFVYKVIPDNFGNVYVTGISFDSLTDYDITTIKYSEPNGIINSNSEIPFEFKLYQNYPNPFNPFTLIKFDIPNAAIVTMKIYDILGREVYILVNSKFFSAGSHNIIFDGSIYPSGVYFYTIEITDINSISLYYASNKMMLIK